MTGDDVPFAAGLRECRQAAGLSQQDLAERAGLSIRAISNLERGLVTWPHPVTMSRLAQALGLTAAATAAFTSSASRRLAGGRARPRTRNEENVPDQTASSRVAAVPRQLPGSVRRFTGRGIELTMLTDLLSQSDADALPGALVVVICGMPGVGKTALAVRWAHQVADRFPDGQLYVDLRGYGPAAAPSRVRDVLAVLLRSLGVPDRRIPAEVGERAAAYRSLLASRRVLVVLDNARDTEQTSLLLPGNASSVTVVTSRDALGGLVVRQGAVRLALNPLPRHDAADLLVGLLGRSSEEDLNAAAELADRCGYLPFALRVAAQLAELSGMAVTDLAAQLSDPRHRLDILEAGGDRHTALRALFGWSYVGLSAAAARMFRLIAAHPAPAISAQGAACLAGLPGPQAVRALTELTWAHLIRENPPGWYSCHDLLRIYGAEQSA
jgi:transcriptional regulator with XRE-family HTH domain